MRMTIGEGRLCASGFTSALTAMFNLTLTGCGFGGAEPHAASAAQAVKKNAIGIARNVRIESLPAVYRSASLLSALRPVQCLEPHELIFICLCKFVAEKIAET